MRLRVAFVGNILDVASAVAMAGHEVVALVGHGGRGGVRRLRRLLRPTPAERHARCLGSRFVNVFGCGLLGVVDDVAATQPDLLLCAGWPGKLPDALLAVRRLGGVNVHPSALPLYRGPILSPGPSCAATRRRRCRSTR